VASGDDGRTPHAARASAPAMLAGAIAIEVNTALLAVADAAGLPTAHGGLLRLLHDIAVPAMPMPSGGAIQLVFHILVGLVMAVVYAVLLEPWLPGRPVTKGLVYAAAAWLMNALVVLPLIGEGVAGVRHLDPAGVVGFAMAHTVFGVVQNPPFLGYTRRAGTAGL